MGRDLLKEARHQPLVSGTKRVAETLAQGLASALVPVAVPQVSQSPEGAASVSRT